MDTRMHQETATHREPILVYASLDNHTRSQRGDTSHKSPLLINQQPAISFAQAFFLLQYIYVPFFLT